MAAVPTGRRRAPLRGPAGPPSPSAAWPDASTWRCVEAPYPAAVDPLGGGGAGPRHVDPLLALARLLYGNALVAERLLVPLG